MIKPVLVVTDYDLNNGGSGSNVLIFKDIQKAIIHAKKIVNEYLQANSLTRSSFTEKWDELIEKEFGSGYKFISYKSDDDNKFNVHVYEQNFED